jgi:hypothetical protein
MTATSLLFVSYFSVESQGLIRHAAPQRLCCRLSAAWRSIRAQRVQSTVAQRNRITLAVLSEFDDRFGNDFCYRVHPVGDA